MRKIAVIAFVFLVKFSSAQTISMTTGLDTNQIGSLLQGIGVSINNFEINCHMSAIGKFSGSSSLTIDQGIALSTGNVEHIIGPNNTGSQSTDFGYPGDYDLNLISGVTTHDACVLEFDARPLGDTLFFNFSFGSEEYPEWVGGGVNDAFAIFVSGSGFSQPTNIAKLPNGITVSIDNVNATSYSQYYIDNINGSTINLDGYTTTIEVELEVTPNSPYHFKIAIADGGDGVYDSGVFLEAFSFKSPYIETQEPSGLFNNGNKRVKFFPNPSKDGLFFSNIPIEGYSVFSIAGIRLTNSYLVMSNVVDLSSFPAGVYFIESTNEDGELLRQKIVRQ